MRSDRRPALGVWRATVTRTDTRGVYVQVPRYGGDAEFGPLDVYDLTGTASAGDPAHTHGPAVLVAGDAVLVALVEGRRDDLVVLGRRRPPV